MEITIDIDAPQPIFTQLMEQIKKAVSTEHLNPGDPLPSIRQLANDLEINSKTVAKAYRLLERDNVIQTKGYRGTFIHPDARAHCELNLLEWLDNELSLVLSRLRDEGFTDSEIRNSFSKIMGSKKN